MNIVLGSDHGGYELKQAIMDHLRSKNHQVQDVGCFDSQSVDYPDFAAPAAELVAAGKADYGIVICGTGLGVSYTANKVKGIRCALCTNEFMARMAREHNDANMLALGARVVGLDLALAIVDAFFAGQFQGGRHAARVAKLTAVEQRNR